jgi:hypothetical protein
MSHCSCVLTAQGRALCSSRAAAPRGSGRSSGHMHGQPPVLATLGLHRRAQKGMQIRLRSIFKRCTSVGNCQRT